MRELQFDAVVIGGGAAGMASGLELERKGFKVAIIEREKQLGGILLQCIHNGFGLHEFKEELTGPEYAERFINETRDSNIHVFLDSTITEIRDNEKTKELFCYSYEHGVMHITSSIIILAMGCRERNRGNVRIPGTRPAGIYTAGLAQQLVNMEGYIPGKNIVIVGSGDIGLIMARRMTWAGCNVHGVIEIQPYPSGITRNIVQCLRDFDIPLYLSHTVSKIYGHDRVEKIDISPIVDGRVDYNSSREIICDTLLLSVGLVPENELSKNVGVEINAQTNGPLVDSTMMTSIEGIFACGNVLHVHDLVDFVSEEAKRTGIFAADYLKNKQPTHQIRIKSGANVRYINPGKIDIQRENSKLYMRSMIVKNDAVVSLKLDNKEIKNWKKSHIQPSEMMSLNLKRKDFENRTILEDSILEISIV